MEQKIITLNDWLTNERAQDYILATTQNRRVHFVIRTSDKKNFVGMRVDGTGQRWEKLHDEIMARLIVVKDSNNLNDLFAEMKTLNSH